MASQSATHLATSLTEKEERRVRRVKSDGRYAPTAKSCIVNWGNSSGPLWDYSNSRILNIPEAVARATNKLTTLQHFAWNTENLNYPEFCTDVEVAKGWINDGSTVVCRTLLNAHSGAGIFLASREEDIVADAKLYTKYIKKKKEFRVHVFRGRVIDVQQKKARTGVDVNYAIRNTRGGWVFCREDLEYSNELLDQAILAVTSLGLDFGAVDLVYNQYHNKYYVIEVNSAPGLEGTTLNKYVESIHGYFLD